MTRRMHLSKDSRGNYSRDDGPTFGTPEFYFLAPCTTLINLEPCHRTKFEHVVADFAKAVRDGVPYEAPEPIKPKR